jgi:hypothetical protein
MLHILKPLGPSWVSGSYVFHFNCRLADASNCSSPPASGCHRTPVGFRHGQMILAAAGVKPPKLDAMEDGGRGKKYHQKYYNHVVKTHHQKSIQSSCGLVLSILDCLTPPGLIPPPHLII